MGLEHACMHARMGFSFHQCSRVRTHATFNNFLLAFALLFRKSINHYKSMHSHANRHLWHARCTVAQRPLQVQTREIDLRFNVIACECAGGEMYNSLRSAVLPFCLFVRSTQKREEKKDTEREPRHGTHVFDSNCTRARTPKCIRM